MDAPKDKHSENGDTDDIPSDFFDELNDEFIDGLSVIDSWDFNRETRSSPKKDTSPNESQKDLRDLISEIKNRPASRSSRPKSCSEQENPIYRRSTSSSRLNDFIKPGSRRDPAKTNEAIRKDKEAKVKTYLAKHLEDDLRPPGTELDDYYNEDIPIRPTEKKPSVVEEKFEQTKKQRSRERRESPSRKRSLHRSPRKSPRRSPRRLRSSPKSNIRSSYKQSPRRTQGRNIGRRSPMRRSPQRKHSPSWRSPYQHRRSRSPLPIRRRRSPLPFRRSKSPRTVRRSRSPRPLRRRELRRSRSNECRDSFLYPEPTIIPYNPTNIPYLDTGTQFAPPSAPMFMAPQEPVYSGSYGGGYDYGVPAMGMPIVDMSASAPQPLPMPPIGPIPMSSQGPGLIPEVPSMVPAPQVISPAQPMAPSTHSMEYSSSDPSDGLAKLYAEGKISKEDYLKLAPNKGVSCKIDDQTKSDVSRRCNVYLSKLSHLLIPKRLVVNIDDINPEQKCLPPKHCSPLKRQASTQFKYTEPTNSAMIQQRNKRIVDSIISTLGFETVVVRKKSSPKNMKDAEVQTTRPYCDVCDIRKNTKTCEASTVIEVENFSSSVHTQVIEEELLSSRAVFNPSGSMGDGATMSIAHMTPAQLVSQLAARAKSLKQPDGEQSSSYGQPSQYNRWNQSNDNYNHRGSGGGSTGGQYQNYYRY